MARKKKNEATVVASPRSREDNVFHTIKIHIKGVAWLRWIIYPELFDYEIIDHDVSEE
jgi:hypothetical protein